jgi:hypothetical protein
MPGKYQLLVEGNDDQFVIYNLLKKYNISCEVSPARVTGTNTILIAKRNNKQDLLDSLDIHKAFADSEMERLGIVLDADRLQTEWGLDKTWKKLRDKFENQGIGHLPEKPISEGTVTEVVLADRIITVGIWIMPDNVRDGILEDFMTYLVPANNLWEHAQNVARNVMSDYHSFAEKDLRKAEIHTWLAWQRTPGAPMGHAIEYGFFNHNVTQAQGLIAWVQRLFDTSR